VYKIFLVFLLLTSFFVQANAEVTPELQRKIRKEIEAQQRLQYKEKVKQKNLAEKIKSKVKQEIKWQNYKIQRQAKKDQLAGRVRMHSPSRFDHEDFIYKIPTWPFNSVFYAENDLCELNLKVNGASRAFDSSGSSRDISRLVFGEKDLVLQDILLASKLLKAGKIQANSAKLVGPPPVTASRYHYYYILADQPIVFDASTSSQRLDLNYARHFRDGDISFGLVIPVIRKENNIRLESGISSVIRSQLEAVSPRFADRFGTLQDLLQEILGASGISFNKKDREVGIGDVQVFANLEIPSEYFERFVTGFKVSIPTANGRKTDKLWDPELGNGGFLEMSLFMGLLKSFNKYFNPHMYLELTGAIPATVNRRVPIKKEYDGVLPASGVPIGDFLLLGQAEIQYLGGTTFSEFDTQVRNFPITVKGVKIRRGPQINLRIGNIIEEVYSRKGFLELFYDLRLKGADYLSLGRSWDGYDPSILTDNTFESEHRLGFSYDYQFSGRQRVNIGFLAGITGRNTPQVLEGNIAYSLEF